MTVKINNRTGIVCGRRITGARCVLWSDDTFEWFSADAFASTFK